jgi:tRNA A64-2'-O-ribosylphosphate transferase
LCTIVENGGAVLVDSTRRGKRMPDALSKTVPIWCAVWNRLRGVDHRVWVPGECVSGQEKAYIEELIPDFVEALKVLVSFTLLR